MAFQVGNPKPANSGRKKGTLNKKTHLLEEILTAKGVNPVEEILKMIPSLEPKQQVDVHLELMSYLYPRRKAVDVVADAPTSPLLGIKVTPALMDRLVAQARAEKDRATLRDSYEET